MRRALLGLLLAATSCSVIFDPAKVPPLVTCTDPSTPEQFGALAGEAPGRLTWSWTTQGAGTYRLCTSVPGGTQNCEDTACAGGECSVVQNGLTDNVRFSATLSGVGCDGGLVGSQTTGASAFDTTQSDAGWFLETTNCSFSDALASGGTVSLELQGAVCVAAFVTGDEGWGDLTLEAEVRHSPTAPGLIAGLGIAQNANGNRIAFLTQPEAAIFPPAFPSTITRRRGGGSDSAVAQGVDFSMTEWQQVRIIRSGKTVSWSQVPLGQPLVERLRWFDTDTQTGRFGIGAAGSGRFEVRRLRVSSRALPLPDGDDQVTYFPGEDGGTLRARKLGFGPNLAPCPMLAECAAANCAPPSGASCAQMTTGFGATQLGYQAPTGLSPDRDWEVKLRFGLPMNAGVGANNLLTIRSQPILESSRLNTQFGGTMLNTVLSDGSWHLATVRFPSDGGVLTGTLDGMPITSTLRWPPPDGSRGIDGLRLGDMSVPIVIHELSVRQP